MVRVMDKLTLEHLAPYLPYGLEFTDMSKDVFGKINTSLLRSTSIDPLLHPQCGKKPILRPLSDLTKEIEHKGEKFVPIEWLKENYTDHKLKFEKPDYIILHDSYSLEQNILGAPLAIIQKLFEWHFDVFGLIAAGLAVDMNTLEGGKDDNA